MKKLVLIALLTLAGCGNGGHKKVVLVEHHWHTWHWR